MISFNEAQQLVISQAKSFGKETISIDDAQGRVLSEIIYADRDYPPFNRSSMDGIAIRFSDWELGIRKYIIVETIFAGNVSSAVLKSGECYKIMTGASVPVIADTVIRREDINEEDNVANVLIDGITIFQNISKRGEDLKVSDVITDKPTVCNTAVTGLLATVGKHEIIAEKLPSVAIITTGDEVVGIKDIVTDVQIRNTNLYVLKSLLKQWSIKPSSIEHVADNKEKLHMAISGQLNKDILIINGAVSAGDADFVPGILEGLGASQIFHKVAIRPGKPIWFGKFTNGPVVFALPGNPYSCIVTFKLFIELFLCHSFGLTEKEELKIPVKTNRIKKTALDEFFPVKISGDPIHAELLHFNSSGDITAMLDADGIAQHPKELLEIKAGTIVSCYNLF